MIIDADGMILGRLASFAARKSLLGENIDIVNSEKAIITGNRRHLTEHYTHKVQRGGPLHGPYYPKEAHLLIKRVIRGMLPYRQERGLTAFKRIKCHLGVPKLLEGKEMTKVDEAHKARLQTKKYLTIGELSKLLGA